MATSGNEPEASHDGGRAGAERAAEPPHLDGAEAASCSPRTVTTGGKIERDSVDQPSQAPKAIDPSTGEPFEAQFISARHGYRIVRHLTPDSQAPGNRAQVDALAFTVVPPPGESARWLMAQMQRFLPLDRLQHRNGCFGFKQSARFGDGVGLVAWGGSSQRGRVYFSIQGKGCALVEDWAALAQWLREHNAKLKRADVAYDDFKGETVSIAWAVEQYRHDGFNAGGRKPRSQVFGDWLAGEMSIKGRTLGIGCRTSGKYCRIYEKGKQLGDSSSPWTRVEVEWHGKDRLIPFELLPEPGKYLAGAYPCLGALHSEQARIKTIANSATIAFEAAVDNARQQTGKLVNVMLQVFGGDVGEVVARLRRDGVPGRIEPYSYHLAESPERLDPNAPGSFAATGALD